MNKPMFAIFFLLLIPLMGFSDYYSQFNQDRIIHENYFWNHRSGVFIDIGAHNGITYSNSYFFEKELGWTGICVEPIPEIFAKLAANRKCLCLQGCITDHSGTGKFYRVNDSTTNIEMLSGLIDKYDPRHFQRMISESSQSEGFTIINVNCYLLNNVLEKNNITHINLLSIDTEGGEFEILHSIDFSKFVIDVILVENNYDDSRFIPFLKEKGFMFVKNLQADQLFIRNGFTPSIKPNMIK